MKINAYIVSIVLVSAIDSTAQESINHLLDFDYKSFEIDSHFKKDCLIDKYIVGDTLVIKVFTQFDCEKFTPSIFFVNNTLKINASNRYAETTKSYYDSATGNYYLEMSFIEPLCCGRCGYILTFKTSSRFSEYPILFNCRSICKCTDETSFEIINGYKVNQTDRFGLKQGTWISFHANSKLARLDSFSNGRLILGYTFDEKGKTIGKTHNDGSISVTFRSTEDTTFFKEMLFAPTKYYEK